MRTGFRVYKKMPNTAAVNWQDHGVLTSLRLLTQWNFYRKLPTGAWDFQGGIDFDAIVPKLLQAYEEPKDYLYCIDIERFYRDPPNETQFRGSLWGLNDAEIERHSDELTRVVRLIQEFAPNNLIGLYSVVPQVQQAFWIARAKLEGASDWQQQLDKWMDHHQRLGRGLNEAGKPTLKGLADALGVLMPSWYPVNFENYGWSREKYRTIRREQLELVLQAAAPYGKDLIFWVSPRSWGSGGRAEQPNDFIAELDLLYNDERIAGFAIYDTFAPQPGGGWWPLFADWAQGRITASVLTAARQMIYTAPENQEGLMLESEYTDYEEQK